jgi:tetratricopeptide (TPR) repeat protein
VPGQASGSRARTLALLGGIFVLAFGVRVAYILQHRASPFFDFPIIDAQIYDLMAQRYAAGRGLTDGAFFWPPLYPWMLGVCYAIFGRDLLGARLWQAAMGAGSCLLLYGIGRMVFGRAVGIAAACVMAIYGTLVYFDGELLVPSLYIVLVLAGLLILLHADRTRSRVGLALWAAAGAVLGLAALARPDILCFLLLAAIVAFLPAGGESGGESRGASGGGRARSILRPLCLGLGALAVIAVVTVRNYRVAHDFVLISGNGGINFYLGNNADAESTVATRPGLAWVHLAGEPARAGITTASASSRYFFAKGWDYLRAHPRDALRLYGRKFASFWNSFEVGRDENVYAGRRDSSLLSLLLWNAGRFGFPFGLVAPLALAGLLVTFSLKDRRRLLLYLFLLAGMGSVLLFFVTARYRLTIVPILILFAVQYVQWMVEGLRAGRKRPVLGSAAVLVLLGLAMNRGFASADRIYGPEEDRYLGFMLHSQGRQAEAEQAYRRALERDSTYADVHVELGQVLLEEGRPGEALAHFEAAHRLLPGVGQTRYLLGLGYEATGRQSDAEAAYRRALEIEPHGEADLRLGILLLDTGRVAEAEGFLIEARRLLPREVNAWYRLSECYYRQRKYREAEAALVGALNLAPDDVHIQQNLRDLRRLMQHPASPVSP